MQVIFLVLAVVLAACDSTPQTTFPLNTSAIVDQDLINNATCGRLSAIGGTNWTPTANMIERLEVALLERLILELELDAAFYEHEQFAPTDYVRRYAGFSLDGRPLIAICGERRSMYERAGQDWRTSYIPFRDGGSASFGGIYDPITGEITYFEFGYYA